MKSVLTEAAAPQILEVDLGSEGPRRAVMLSEEVSASAQADDLLAGLPSDERAWVAAEGPGVAVRHTIVLGYGDLTTEQALRRLLPPDIKEVPTAFETAGHVAHLNLREEVLPHKKLVAQVILDKNAHLRSVVNKTASIATEYRTFPLEVLAGTKDLVVELKEGGANFKFDFEKVYWNSRLGSEHARLTNAICARKWEAPVAPASPVAAASESPVSKGESPGESGQKRRVGESGPSAKKRRKHGPGKGNSGSTAPYEAGSGLGVVVADLMAGVGPFAVPLGLRGARVLANDLNPASHEWLVHNAKLNRVQTKVEPFNVDARRFVALLRGRAQPADEKIGSTEQAAAAAVAEAAAAAEAAAGLGSGQQAVWFDHAIMNLPQDAPEFLDAFKGLLYVGQGRAQQGLVLEELGDRKLPMVHCYCFEKEVEGEEDGAQCAAVRRASRALGFELARDQVDVHVVRLVSPRKPMLCLSFRLPLEVATAKPIDLE